MIPIIASKDDADEKVSFDSKFDMIFHHDINTFLQREENQVRHSNYGMQMEIMTQKESCINAYHAHATLRF